MKKFLIVCLLLLVNNAFAEFNLSLYKTTYSASNNRMTYSYQLQCNTTDLNNMVINQTVLTMDGMAAVLSQGDALYWCNAGFTDFAAQWVYDEATPFTVFKYFDIIADNNITEAGIVNYHLNGTSNTTIGPTAIFTPPNQQVNAYVFFDINKNHTFDNMDVGLDNIGVTYGENTQYTTLIGFADFGNTNLIDTMQITDDGPYKLNTYWSLSCYYNTTVDNVTTFYFGYYPNICNIHEDLENNNISGNNHTIGFWKNNIRKALENHNGTQVDTETLSYYLIWVEGIAYNIPFNFGVNRLNSAYEYLTSKDQLTMQLLAAELNWVSGYNSSEPGLEYMMLVWGEYMWNNGTRQDKIQLANLLDHWNNL